MTQAALFRYYYASACYGYKYRAILSGPFVTHQAALDDLPRAKRAALNHSDPRFAFCEYGTLSTEINVGNGAFNV